MENAYAKVDDSFLNLDIVVRLVDSLEERLDILEDESYEKITNHEFMKEYKFIVNEVKDQLSFFVDSFVASGGDVQDLLYEYYENFPYFKDAAVRTSFLKSIVDSGANLDFIYEDGESILFKAVVCNEVDLVKELLGQKASCNLLLNRYPIWHEVKNESSSIVEEQFNIQKNRAKLKI